MIRLTPLIEALWKNAHERPKNVPKEMKDLWKLHDKTFATYIRTRRSDRIGVTTFWNMMKNLYGKASNYYGKVKYEIDSQTGARIAKDFSDAKRLMEKGEDEMSWFDYGPALSTFDMALVYLHSAIDHIAEGLVRAQT